MKYCENCGHEQHDGPLYKEYRENILNFNKLRKAIKITQPHIIFHLAAQSSVLESYKTPKEKGQNEKSFR